MALRVSTGFRDKLMTPAADGGKSWGELLDGGIIHIYSGTQPADADTAESGDLLVKITKDGLALGSGGGLSLGNATNGKISKPAADDWKGTAVADGTAGWFRFYDSNETTGTSTTAVRFDGRVATSGGELRVVTTTIADESNQVIANFSIEFPA
jgi:hypothetical protein